MEQNDLSSYDAINTLANSMPYGSERTLLREKAMNLADLTNDARLQFETRKEFLRDICMDGGFKEKYFTIFPWMLNFAQTQGDDDDKWRVLWYYKWVMGMLHEIPSISKSQMENALEDLRKRYLEYGSNEKVYHQYACLMYAFIGEHEKSKYHYARWNRFKKDDYLDDCEACIVSRHVDYQCRLGTVEDALKIGQPVLTGKLSCLHVPKCTYAYVLLPLVRNNKHELANEYAEKLYKILMKGNLAGDSYYTYSLIIYLTWKGDLTRAINLFQRYMRLNVEQKNLYQRFYFFTAALYLFTKTDKEKVKLKLPKKIAFFKEDSIYEVAMLREWFDKETDNIAALFDKRNENDMMSREKQALLSL